MWPPPSKQLPLRKHREQRCKAPEKPASVPTGKGARPETTEVTGNRGGGPKDPNFTQHDFIRDKKAPAHGQSPRPPRTCPTKEAVTWLGAVPGELQAHSLPSAVPLRVQEPQLTPTCPR